MSIKSIVIGFTLACSTITVSAADLQLNTDYTVLPSPQAVANKKKVEVIEFFSYNCPHCADLESPLEVWSAKLPKYVVFKRIPVAFREDWVPAAKLFYAIEGMRLSAKETTRMHKAAFEAVQSGRVDFTNPDAAANWAAQVGMNRAKFAEGFTTFGTQMKVQNAAVIARNYGINGVPSIIVQGKYQARGANFDKQLHNATRLVEKARAEK